jgi:hypothetical protein
MYSIGNSNDGKNNKNIPMNSGDDSSSDPRLKAAPVPFKLLDHRSSTDVTMRPDGSSLLSPTMMGDSGNKDDTNDRNGGYRIMSKSYGGDPYHFFTSMMRAPPPPASVQR